MLELAFEVEEHELAAGPADGLDPAVNDDLLVGMLAHLDILELLPEDGDPHGRTAFMANARILEGIGLYQLVLPSQVVEAQICRVTGARGLPLPGVRPQELKTGSR